MSYIPSDRDLPSTRKLIGSTILAAVTAGVLLVTVVMPAEYGIDPTGIGNLLGLKKMGEIRVSLDKEAAADKAKNSGINPDVTQSDINAAPTSKPTSIDTTTANNEKTTEIDAANISKPVSVNSAIRNDTMQVKLAPDDGVEIKADMSKGKKLQYTWSSDGGKANFDVHADSKKSNIDYYQYSKGSAQSKEGEIEAAFDGSHGWFWRNRTGSPITITLKTTGEYTNIKRVK
jgi:hypothetical protein